MERTTVTFESGLLKKLRQLAVSKSTTISHLVNEIIWSHLFGKSKARNYRLDWHPEKGAIQPGVDVADRDALFEIMEKDR